MLHISSFNTRLQHNGKCSTHKSSTEDFIILPGYKCHGNIGLLFCKIVERIIVQHTSLVEKETSRFNWFCVSEINTVKNIHIGSKIYMHPLFNINSVMLKVQILFNLPKQRPLNSVLLIMIGRSRRRPKNVLHCQKCQSQCLQAQLRFVADMGKKTLHQLLSNC